MNAYVNPANAVTASRYLTLPAFVYWLDRGDYQLATIAVIVCGVLDLFDGAVARAFNCASGFGELLDAITDAVCYGFFMVVLATYDRLPWVPVVGILALGVVNAAFARSTPAGPGERPTTAPTPWSGLSRWPPTCPASARPASSLTTTRGPASS